MPNAAHTNQTAKISVRTVGQSFGCESNLKIGRKVIWTSRIFPFGFNSVAIAAATEKANSLGYTAVSR